MFNPTESITTKWTTLKDEISKFITDLETRRQNVIQDADLSETGKEKALNALERQRKEKRTELATKLRKMAVTAAIEETAKAGAQQLLERLEDEKMDFSRLTYESTAARSAIALAGNDADRIAELWQQVKDTGNPYKIRAWLDTAPAIILAESEKPGSYNREVLGGIFQDMATSRGLIHSEQMRSLETEKLENMNVLAEIKVVTDVIQDMEKRSGYKGIVARVFSGIQRDKKTGELTTEFRRALDETTDKAVARIEAEYSEQVKAQAEVFEHFAGAGRFAVGGRLEALDYDPLIDGVGE